MVERPGAGPRHLAFHPAGSYAYLINELDSTVTAYSYDGESGRLQPLQAISTLPPDFKGHNTCAEIAVAPSGEFVYGSNRGHDSIVVYQVDRQNGKLTTVGWTSTQGRTPRFFLLDPQGNRLYAANQDSDTIVSFKIDRADGTLSPTGKIVETGSPVCIAFA